MKSKTVAGLMIPFLIVLVTGCATTPDPETGETGYFLSMKQKGQLISQGRMEDAAGNWYDVWIVPGYVDPARRSKTGLIKTGRDFSEYGKKKKYHDLAKNSSDAFEWAYDDCLVDFTIKGVPRRWDKYFTAAHQRTSKKVFGWWAAYPWALLEGTVDTTVRIPVGLTGTALGTVWGAGVVPIYYAVNSSGKGTWHFAAETVALPASAMAWNTVISPPLSLLGQKPAPSRVDGFWVQSISAEQRAAEEPLTHDELKALALWGRLLLDTSEPYDEKVIQNRHDTRKKIEEIQSQSREEEQRIRQERKQALEYIDTNDKQEQALTFLKQQGFNGSRTQAALTQLRDYLSSQGYSDGEILRIEALLRRNPPSTSKYKSSVRPKTDPVSRSIDVIKDMD